jgi:hypothetical protein
VRPVHAGDVVEGLAVWLRGIAGMARAVPRLLQHLHLQVRVDVSLRWFTMNTMNTVHSWPCVLAFLQVAQ